MNVVLSSLIYKDWVQNKDSPTKATITNTSFYGPLSTVKQSTFRDYTISNCKFIWLNDKSINIYGRSLKLLVQECVFSHNYLSNPSSSFGVNIVFGVYGEFYQKQVVSYQCSTKEDLLLGIHSSSYADEDTNEYLSISGTTHKHSDNTLSIFYDQPENYKLSQSNISSIKELSYIAEFGDITKSNIVEFSIFKNFTGQHIFRYYTPSSNDLNQQIVKCSFIENEVERLITSDGITISASECNFVGNVNRNKAASNRFETENNKAKITLSNCYISGNAIESSGSGVVTTSNNVDNLVQIEFSFTEAVDYDYTPVPTGKFDYQNAHKWVYAKP